MMRKVVAFAFAILLFFVFIGCAKKEGEKGQYLAMVGNTKITRADLDREMKSLPDFAQKLFEGKEGQARFLNELIKKDLLYQEALKKGLDKDPAYQNKVEEFKKLTLIQLLLEKEIEARANVTEQEARDYYEKHKADLASVSQIRASHILVKTEAEANKIENMLKKGANFAELAKKYSIDTGSAKNGGDLGYFSPGQMVQEFETAAAGLKPGEVSEPVKTKFGYHIIKVTGKKMGKPVDFEKVKSAIMQRLSAEKQKTAFDEYVDGLKKTFKVQINEEALSNLGPAEEKKESTEEIPSSQAGASKEEQNKETKGNKK